jgi:hypothetical protein
MILFFGISSLTIFLFGIYKIIFGKTDNKIEQSKTYNDNVSILESLGYYNLNINNIKECFILDCTKYLLYVGNPNYTFIDTPEDFKEEYSFYIKDLENTFLNKLHEELLNYCITKNKLIKDLTFNELRTFITNTTVYKNLEERLNFMMLRAIVLSKYLNDLNTDRLIDALNYKELDCLTK